MCHETFTLHYCCSAFHVFQLLDVGDFRISDSQKDTTDIDLSSESFIGKLCVAFALDEVGGQVGGNMGEIGDWNDNPSIGGGSGLPIILCLLTLPMLNLY